MIQLVGLSLVVLPDFCIIQSGGLTRKNSSFLPTGGYDPVGWFKSGGLTRFCIIQSGGPTRKNSSFLPTGGYDPVG